MSVRIEVIDKKRIKLIQQASILGFIDIGSTFEEEFIYDERTWRWRSVVDGRRAEFGGIEEAVERWEFLQRNALASKAKSE